MARRFLLFHGALILLGLEMIGCSDPYSRRAQKPAYPVDNVDNSTKPDPRIGISCDTHSPCPEGYGCTPADGCQAAVCELDSAVCKDTQTALICNPWGTAYESVACFGNRRCDQAAPYQCFAPLACVADDRRCQDAHTPDVCRADGSGWDTQASCSAQGFAPKCYNGTCLSKCDVAELSLSYVGCRYYGADLGDFFPSSTSMFTFAFAVGNADSEDTATVSLHTEHGVIETIAVAPGQLGVFKIAPPRSRHNIGTGKRTLGYFIESDVPVAVYQFNPLETAEYSSNSNSASRVAASTDASMLLPAHALDDRYYVMAWEQTPATAVPSEVPMWQSYSGGSLLAVMAAGETVDVTLTLTASSPLGPNVPALMAGTTTTIRLEPFQVLQLTTLVPNQDYTGTYIEATGKIAVFGGNECARVPAGTNYCDRLEQQMFGLTAWGHETIATKSSPRGQEVDVYRILAAENDTLVQFSPASISAPRTLAAGEYFDILSQRDFAVFASAPILVSQFFVGSANVAPGCDAYSCSKTGDPTMILLPPTEQFRDDYVFLVPNTYTDDFINIVIVEEDTTLTLDDIPLSNEPFSIEDTGYAVIRMAVSPGHHRLQSSKPVGLIVYGYGGDDTKGPLDPLGPANVSYGYPGGLNMLPINPKVSFF